MKRINLTNVEAAAVEEALRRLMFHPLNSGERKVMRRQLRAISRAFDKLVMAPNTEAPRCGHSACRQNWIDTGERACVASCRHCGGDPKPGFPCCDRAAEGG